MVIEDSRTVEGVLLADETNIHSSIVLSKATPCKTFVDLKTDRNLSDHFLNTIKNCDSHGGDSLRRQDALNGLPSERPVVELTIPSVLDKMISPLGTHYTCDFSMYVGQGGDWR